ncbi:MAG: hypothetical protein VB141_13310 [Burkholderia gladioli]
MNKCKNQWVKFSVFTALEMIVLYAGLFKGIDAFANLAIAWFWWTSVATLLVAIFREQDIPGISLVAAHARLYRSLLFAAVFVCFGYFETAALTATSTMAIFGCYAARERVSG